MKVLTVGIGGKGTEFATKMVSEGWDAISVGTGGEKYDEEILAEELKGNDAIIIVCGIGGDTSALLTPRVAKLAKEMRILTIGVVIKPFSFEEPKRLKNASECSKQLTEYMDTVFFVSSDHYIAELSRSQSPVEAYKNRDLAVIQVIRRINEMVMEIGIISVSWDEFKEYFRNKGTGYFGIGIGHGSGMIEKAANMSLDTMVHRPDLSDKDRLLVSICGDISLSDVSKARSLINERVGGDRSNDLLDAVYDDSEPGCCMVMVIAIGK